MRRRERIRDNGEKREGKRMVEKNCSIFLFPWLPVGDGS